MESLTKEQLFKIAEIAYSAQAELGDKMAGPDWRTKGLPFYRAIMREYAECFDHIPWEWWKKQHQMEFTDTRRQQTMLELTDVFCFGMSDRIASLPKYEHSVLSGLWVSVLTTIMDKPLETTDSLETLRESIETAIENTLMLHNHSETDLALVYRAIGATPKTIYLYYFGKNALNHFRQDNGDKLGQYPRTWEGIPDNEVLADIVEALDTTLDTNSFVRLIEENEIIPVIKTALQVRYNLIAKGLVPA